MCELQLMNCFSLLKRLRILYTKILGSLQTMPQGAAYRKYTEQLITERFNHVKAVRYGKYTLL